MQTPARHRRVSFFSTNGWAFQGHPQPRHAQFQDSTEAIFKAKTKVPASHISLQELLAPRGYIFLKQLPILQIKPSENLYGTGGQV